MYTSSRKSLSNSLIFWSYNNNYELSNYHTKKTLRNYIPNVTYPNLDFLEGGVKT